jgi:hypothetical protein
LIQQNLSASRSSRSVLVPVVVLFVFILVIIVGAARGIMLPAAVALLQ